MRVLVVGSGGRESAISWACGRHGHDVSSLAVWAPVADRLVPALDGVDLVIVGPEAALVDGVADECRRHGVACFGPTAALARLESSKGYARELADSLGIPGPAYARFDKGEHDEAAVWWRRLGRAVVVKHDGLAAGKGVVVPEGDDETAAAIAAVQGPFVLEERMYGPECSLLALCDGHVAVALPLAQDHKRIGEGDTGLNTGGMGAFAPAPVDEDPDELVARFVEPVLDHLADAGTPYVGVLYAGLMLTDRGPRLVEYNCRLGDPEAQAVLPLIRSDFAAHALACTHGELAAERLETTSGAAVAVVAAAAGYPQSPRTGDDVDLPVGDVLVFDAGLVRDAHGRATTSGGRVLAVTGLGTTLAQARAAAYDAMAGVRFDGMQVRRDIGWRAPGATVTSYAAAGVDIDKGAMAVDQMRRSVERTHGPEVMRGVGSFGGVFRAKALTAMADPVLVASTDGVGTKVELAARAARFGGVGIDIVNHCVNDVLVQNARPLFFLDYLASSRLDVDRVAAVVAGMGEACEAAGCALLGGETAEMPGVYQRGAFDVAGTLIGAAEAADLLPRPDVAAGDVLVGLASNGPHTNGYSLLRTVFDWCPLDAMPGGLDRPLGDALLQPHRSYLPVLRRVLDGGVVKALVHVTGGGLPDNLPRVLPGGVGARIELGSWPVPPLFELVRELTPRLGMLERYRTLNMGIGMVVICGPDDVDTVRSSIDEQTWVIGALVAGSRAVELVS